MAAFRRSDDPNAWSLATCYAPKGVADEIARKFCWPNDEGETVGLLVVQFGKDALVDRRVNPILVTWRDGTVWLWARNTRSKLVNDTYAALECAGFKVRGIGQVMNLRRIGVDWLA